MSREPTILRTLNFYGNFSKFDSNFAFLQLNEKRKDSQIESYPINKAKFGSRVAYAKAWYRLCLENAGILNILIINMLWITHITEPYNHKH